MEVTVVSPEKQPFLGWPEDRKRTVGDDDPQSALAGVTNMTEVRRSLYADYRARTKEGEIKAEAVRDGYVYYAIQTGRDVPVAAPGGASASATVLVTERFKARVPPGESR